MTIDISWLRQTTIKLVTSSNNMWYGAMESVDNDRLCMWVPDIDDYAYFQIKDIASITLYPNLNNQQKGGTS